MKEDEHNWHRCTVCWRFLWILYRCEALKSSLYMQTRAQQGRFYELCGCNIITDEYCEECEHG